MIYEIACRTCGKIARDDIPLPKKDASIEVSCPNCKSILLEVYGDQSPITKSLHEQSAS